ncbi:hypothetical protein IMG5_169500 [Ichthyophthirius multifiliis]|uniref:RNA helicase n=1 Tax=Ichthyophthirius multifiliis TaxID=5932 RepID=G0R1C0_ICHMU|nr:hypothetical protein IMG5_169500 [Ichthyophthirius multifiliis]EGR28753.1 hypothetical protein IMG5_169500 [Ichthyophthirius multifiliis]|eukprot:XP_004029989.1 hypothetical protein IMG5_169500 [Ichthyophthirius multifiliis]
MGKDFTNNKRTFSNTTFSQKSQFPVEKKTKNFKPKDREWIPESEDEQNKPKNTQKIEAQHDKGNMQKYIKNKKTIDLLNKRNITYLFPIQEHCFKAIQAGKDVIGKDRTGSGKTLGYSLPLIEKLREDGFFGVIKRRQSPYVLILVPTRELCIQVANEISSLKHSDNEFRVLQIYGGTDIREQTNQLRDGCEIAVGTPGRIIDQFDRGNLILSNLKTVILDEADQMLNFGFQDDIEKIFKNIVESRESLGLPRTQNLLFSATVPSWVHEISRKYLQEQNIVMIDLVRNNDNKTSQGVTHLAINCPFYQRTEAIGDVILCYGGGAHSRVIIFCETKNEANEIMLKANIKQDLQVLHGDIPQKQREITFQGFREGKFKCLVATNVASRGLDIPEVDLIVQLEPPKELDTYIHRAGRTGRAGKTGVCITFFTKKQVGLIERIEKKCHIKMKIVGAPQPGDIVKASQTDIKKNLKTVNQEVVSMFQQVSEDLIQEFGPQEALSRALAYISGYIEGVKQRSLLCCLEGYCTYIVKAPHEIRGLGYIWNWLKSNFDIEVVDRVKGMKKCADSLGAVFDVAESDIVKFEEYIQNIADGAKKGLLLEKATVMPKLEDDMAQGFGNNSNYNNGGNNTGFQGFSQNGNIRMDQQTKKELEIFVGGLPFDIQEREVTQFFNKNLVRFTQLRPLNDNEGNFKGIVFAICENKNSVQKALALNGEKLKGRSLRINMAAKK